MQETGNNAASRRPRLTIRVGRKSMSFAVADAAAEHGVCYEPYTVRSGISMAANLRAAFRESPLLSQGYERAMVLVDSPVLMVPLDEFREETMETFYRHAFMGREADVVAYNVLTALNAVAVFAVNKDLKLVADDHFGDVKIAALCSPVWNHLHQRSFTGNRRKLYGYFHDQRLDVASFWKNRFRFCNSYQADRYMDAAYFLLFAWKQLALDSHRDELHLVGDIPERDELLVELRKYVQNVYVINPSADFNRAPASQIKNFPYDLMTYYVKGR